MSIELLILRAWAGLSLIIIVLMWRRAITLYRIVVEGHKWAERIRVIAEDQYKMQQLSQDQCKTLQEYLDQCKPDPFEGEERKQG